MSFEDGTVVWVKLQGASRLWWVGQVTNEFPEDLLARIRNNPIAVVRFFSDKDEFEVVKKPADILLYNCERREEFIKKGKQQKHKGQLEKFVADCKHAESLTGGKADVVDTVDAAQSTPKKPVYAELFKQAPPPRPALDFSGLVKLNFKKTGSPSKKAPTPQVVEGKNFKCDQCNFTCERVNVLTSHRRTHAAGSSASALSIPAKPKSPAKASALEITPKKIGSPAKSPPGRRGKKRKAGKEFVPPAADKQEILADWSDADGDNPESPNPLAEDRDPKKPRTKEELSDAFESLLKTTKPSDTGLVNAGSSQATLKSDVDDRSDDDEFFHCADTDILESEVGEEAFENPLEAAISTEAAVAEEAFEKSAEAAISTEAAVGEEAFEKSAETAISTEAAVGEEASEKSAEAAISTEAAVGEEAFEKPAEAAISTEAAVGEEAFEKPAEAAISTEAAVGEEALEKPAEAGISTEAAPAVKGEASESISTKTRDDTLEEKVEVPPETEIKEETQPEPAPKSNPTAKIIGVCKVIQSPAEVKPETEKTEKKEKDEGIDDAEELQNEVDALLAATMPIELNHEQLFAARPDLQYKVSHVQLKSEISPPASSAPISPIPIPIRATSPQQKRVTSSPQRAKKSQPPPVPTKSPMAGVVPSPSISKAEVHPIPQPTAITLTQAVAIKSQPPGQILLKSEVGSPGALKITKAPPPTMIQEKIVVIHGDSSTARQLKGQSIQLQQTVPIMSPQAVKVYSTYPVTSAPQTPPTTPAKKGRAKKQTLTERAGVMQHSPVSPATQSPVGKFTSLSPAQLIASPSTAIGANVVPTAVQTVQSYQTKVHALPTVSAGLRGTASTGTGMVRLTASASLQHQQLRASSPAILTKSGTQFKYQRHQGPFATSPNSASHYQIVTSTSPGQSSNDLVFLSQPTPPSQRLVITSPLAAGASSVSHLMSASQKKRAPIKKAVPGPAVVKLPEVLSKCQPLPKPTAAIKPTLSEEEQLNSAKNAKIREALIAGQKTEKILTAEKVVHLLPIQNKDGTVTYMLVHLDDEADDGGVRLDQVEGPAIYGHVEPIYMDKEESADNVLATIIHKHSKPPTPRKTAPRKPPAPRGKVTQTLVIPTDQVQLQKQPAQPRQAVIGQQQQQVTQRHPQPTTSQHLHHPFVQSPGQATTPSSYHVVQKQTTIGHQQPPQRQVFVSQPQQVIFSQQQQQPVTTTTTAQIETPVVDQQSFQIQQAVQVQVAAAPTPVAFATETALHVQQPAQATSTQEQQFVHVQQAEESQMPALIETKVVEAATSQPELTEPQETQQVQYIIQQHEEGDSTVATAGQEMNVEVPMEMQDYFQIVTGEDGNQYYIAPEGMAGDASQGYYQIQTDGETVSYEYAGVGGEEQQYLILQEDGTLVSPQSLGMDLSQVLALQQQAEMEGQVEQQFTEAEGQVQVQEPDQPNV